MNNTEKKYSGGTVKIYQLFVELGTTGGEPYDVLIGTWADLSSAEKALEKRIELRKKRIEKSTICKHCDYNNPSCELFEEGEWVDKKICTKSTYSFREDYFICESEILSLGDDSPSHIWVEGMKYTDWATSTQFKQYKKTWAKLEYME